MDYTSAFQAPQSRGATIISTCLKLNCKVWSIVLTDWNFPQDYNVIHAVGVDACSFWLWEASEKINDHNVYSSSRKSSSGYSSNSTELNWTVWERKRKRKAGGDSTLHFPRSSASGRVSPHRLKSWEVAALPSLFVGQRGTSRRLRGGCGFKRENKSQRAQGRMYRATRQ